MKNRKMKMEEKPQVNMPWTIFENNNPVTPQNTKVNNNCKFVETDMSNTYWF